MSKASCRRKVTSAKITDWVEPSFEDFFGSSRKVTSQAFGASKRGVNKKDESTLENTSQSKKRANPFSANHCNDGVKATSGQSQNDPWIDKYRPSVQADLAVHKKKVEEVETWLRAHADKKTGWVYFVADWSSRLWENCNHPSAGQGDGDSSARMD